MQQSLLPSWLEQFEIISQGELVQGKGFHYKLKLKLEVRKAHVLLAVKVIAPEHLNELGKWITEWRSYFKVSKEASRKWQ